MFSRASRYRDLPDVVTVDASGRRLSSRELRLPEPVPGRHRHTVTEGDRLDALADRYYRKPANWWRICDANPEILSPQALVGAEPVLTHRIEVTSQGAGPPAWADLLRALNARVGVVRAVLVGDSTVEVRYNRLNLTVADIAAAMTSHGFTATGAVEVGRAGARIVIPPDVTG